MTFRVFDIDGITMLGNLKNGLVVGLETWEVDICNAFLDGRLSIEELSGLDRLLASVIEGAFAEEASSKTFKCAYLHITDRCNLNCRGCYSRVSSGNEGFEPTFEQIKQALTFLSRWGIIELNISGGEPFLRRDLPEIVAEAKHQGIAIINILTNGTVCDISELIAIAPFVASVSVSIDTSSSSSVSHIRGENRFETLIGFALACKKAGIRTYLTPTLHGLNYNEIDAYCDLAEKNGLGINFSLLSASGNDENIEDVLFDSESLREIALGLSSRCRFDSALLDGIYCRECCGAGSSVLSISAEGDIFPCHILHRDSFCLGNAFEYVPLPLDLSRLKEVRQGILCADATCDYFYVCGGGCIARAINSGLNVDPYCLLYKSFNEALLEKLSCEGDGRRVVSQ